MKSVLVPREIYAELPFPTLVAEAELMTAFKKCLDKHLNHMGTEG